MFLAELEADASMRFPTKIEILSIWETTCADWQSSTPPGFTIRNLGRVLLEFGNQVRLLLTSGAGQCPELEH
ncbi:MAG: hypothetical protein CMJ81_12805 [Planctomycetaceae bacterium]|nr:hypothetical protein [Planctomycetaceae bacterium]